MMEVIDERTPIEVIKDVSTFATILLKHGIAEIQFNIEWFQGLREELALNGE